ncbi:MAG: hypothetical protein RLZZ628_2931 [Bacteroidota bacterium]|jgi:hypothetical protein
MKKKLLYFIFVNILCFKLDATAQISGLEQAYMQQSRTDLDLFMEQWHRRSMNHSKIPTEFNNKQESQLSKLMAEFVNAMLLNKADSLFRYILLPSQIPVYVVETIDYPYCLFFKKQKPRDFYLQNVTFNKKLKICLLDEPIQQILKQFFIKKEFLHPEKRFSILDKSSFKIDFDKRQQFLKVYLNAQVIEPCAPIDCDGETIDYYDTTHYLNKTMLLSTEPIVSFIILQKDGKQALIIANHPCLREKHFFCKRKCRKWEIQ